MSGEEPTAQFFASVRRTAGPAKGEVFVAYEGERTTSSGGPDRVVLASTLDEVFDAA